MVGPDRPNALLETPRRSLLSRCGCSVFRRMEGGGWAVLTCCRCVRFKFWRSFFGRFFWLTYVDIDTVGISWVIPARRSSICWWNSLGCDAVLDRAHCPAIMGWCFSRSLLKFYLQLAIWLALVGSKQGFFRLVMSPPIYQQNCGFVGDVHEERQVWHGSMISHHKSWWLGLVHDSSPIWVHYNDRTLFSLTGKHGLFEGNHPHSWRNYSD